MAIVTVNPAGDLQLVGHKLVFASGADAVRQKVATRFQWFKGEWFLDRRQGLPYFQHVFTAHPNKQLIRGLFRNTLLGTPGIGGASKFDIVFDTQRRTVAFDFAAWLSNGVDTLIVSPEDRDFIIDVS